jgi:NAD(P)H dehydrogenase (quinone)
MIAVTGATGQLGRLVLAELIARGQLPATLVALVRDPAKAAGLAAQGIAVRPFDYRTADAAALAGVDRLLLISSSDFDDRIGQHTNAIAAARAAGVGLIAYTSILRADTTPIAVAADHRATEAAIRASGLPFQFLRHGWYAENYTAAIAAAAQHGVLQGSAGAGRIATASRADYAAADAAALLTATPGSVLELAGDAGFTKAELAALVAQASGRPVAYTDLPLEAYAAALEEAGLPAAYAFAVAQADAQVPGGWLDDTSRTLSRLAGRPTAPIRDLVRDTASRQAAAA